MFWGCWCRGFGEVWGGCQQSRCMHGACRGGVCVQGMCTCVSACAEGVHVCVCAGELQERVCLCVHGMCTCVCLRAHRMRVPCVCVHRFLWGCAGLRVHRVPGVVPMRVQGPCVPPPSGAVTPPFLPGTRCPHGTVAHPSAHAGRHRAAGASSDHVDPGGQRAQKGLAQGWMEMWGPPQAPCPVPATRGRAGSPWRARAPSRPRVHRHMSQ